LAALAFSLTLAGCGTGTTRPSAQAGVPKSSGGYYQDDGPGDHPPADLAAIADAVPRDEPLSRYANRPYTVLGKRYVPMREVAPYHATGIASWYGRKFHGQKTSSGEIYDMYSMTAAHKTLPIPSYARVTNPANGRSVIVRINDRGPFHAGRLIDLSYTAAWKLGYIGDGSARVEVDSVVPGAVLAAAPAAAEDESVDPIARLAVVADSPAESMPVVDDAGGIYLQLAAFGNADNAEALRNRLARELSDLGGRLVIRAEDGLFRLQFGPWSSRAQARRVAERIAESMALQPIVVQR
jgi:rare lipoprotein A